MSLEIEFESVLKAPRTERMAKRSLAEQISELSKPKTDYDIEDNEFQEGAFDEDEEPADLSSDQEQMKKEHYVKTPKSSLRKLNDPIELGERYTGKVASRADLFDGSEDEGAFEGFGSGSENEEQVVGDDDLDVSDGQDEDASSDLNEVGSPEDEEDIDLSASESEEDEDISEGELQNKRTKLKQILENERKEVVKRLSQSATEDASKGYAILQQNKLFDSLIEVRLKIQKPLQQSNLLPPSHEVLRSENLGSKKTQGYAEEAQKMCFDALDKISKLRRKLFKEDGISTKGMPRNPKKRTLEDYVKHTKAQDSLLNTYRSSVLTKWSTKIQNSSGASAMNAGKFKVINQSAEQQVLNNLSTMDRLVKRTKVNRRNIKPLGYEAYASTLTQEQEDNEENPEDLDVPHQENRNAASQQEMDIIYDDDDFYRVLLNDLVDKKLQMNNPTSGMSINIKSAQKASKARKNIDTKASKGRKLKFTVQDKIANFETPREAFKWDNDQIDEFFASLLGQKINMSERMEDEDADGEAAEEEGIELTSADGIKLFN